MANFRKSFNFRNGVQVDEDNFIVNSVGLVGIGTSVPTESLDIRGSLKVVGVATIQDAFIGVATVQNKLEVGITSFSSGIITAKTGIVTYYGDARYLQGMPTSQWVDIDVGLGYTSIYAAGNVGVGTVDPRFTFQVGGNNDVSNFSRGVGISDVGDVKIAGIATITKIYGYGIGVTGLNAGDAIATGTLSNDRLPSNINKPTGIVTVSSVTADNFNGPLTGTASTAQSLTGTPNIEVGIITASKLVADTIEVPNTGITTIAELLHVGTDGTAFTALSSGRIGVGTPLPTSEIQVRKASGSLVEVVSDSGQARISVGQSVGAGKSTGVIRFGNSAHDLDIINNDNEGDINFLLNGNGSAGTGKFSWQDGSTFNEVMSLDANGNFSVSGVTTLASVGGITTTGGDLYVEDDLYVKGNINGTITLPSIINGNISVNSGISTFNTILQNKIGIGTTNPIVDIDARNSSALLRSIGIGTTNPLTDIDARSSSTLVGSIGIGTTNTQNNAVYINGKMSQYGSNFDIYDGAIHGIRSSIGIGTTTANAAVDFADAGKDFASGIAAYMILPKLNSAERTGLSTVSGAVIFNTDTSKFQGFDGTSWVDFH